MPRPRSAPHSCASAAVLVAIALAGSAVPLAGARADVADEAAPASAIRVVEGDILTDAPPVSDDRAAQRRSIAFGRERLWPDGTMPVWIDPSIGADSSATVRAAIAVWNGVPGVRIEEVAEPLDDQRDHVRFEVGEGCASWVGRRGGAQSLWVAPRCNLGSVLHEIGHALGLEHEHTRADRDAWILIHWDNVLPDKRHNFDVAPAGARSLGPYDYDSIMHYGEDFFSANGQRTIEPLDPAARIGQRNAPSAGDIDAMATLYGTDLALSADLYAAAASDEDVARAGSRGALELDVIVGNDGLNGAHDVQLELALPNGWALTPLVAVDDWRCDSATTCTLAHLASGHVSRLTLRVSFDQALQPDASLRISLSSDTADSLSDNDVALLRRTSSGSGSPVFVDVTRTIDRDATDPTGFDDDGAGTIVVGGSGAVGAAWSMLTAMLWRRRRRRDY